METPTPYKKSYGQLVDPTPAGITPAALQLAAETELEAPVPYQGVKYDRSDVKFVHLPLRTYLNRRGLPLPEQFEALLAHMPPGTFIAGGSVAALATGRALTAASDIDLFFLNDEAHQAALKLLKFAGKLDQGPHIPEGVTAFKAPEGRDGLPIQAINIAWFDDIEEVLDGFDFTCTMFGIDVGAGELVFNPESVRDYTQRLLLNHRSEGDEASAKRLAKYIAKGFVPVGETLARAKALGLWNDAIALDQAVIRRAERVS